MRIKTQNPMTSGTDIRDSFLKGETGGLTMRSAIHALMKLISYLFLAALVVTVVAVVLVIVGPILLDIDILAEPTYTRIEDFMRQALRYIIVAAIGYIIFSWGRKLSEPGESREEKTKPRAPSPPPLVSAPSDPGPPSSSRVQSQSSHSYRPEAVPPTHP